MYVIEILTWNELHYKYFNKYCRLVAIELRMSS